MGFKTRTWADLTTQGLLVEALIRGVVAGLIFGLIMAVTKSDNVLLKTCSSASS